LECAANVGDGDRIVALAGYHLTFDVALPVAYGLFLVFSIEQLVASTAGQDSLLIGLVVVPLAAGAFDLLENAGITVICLNYPKVWTSPVAATTGWLTVGKFLALALSVVIAAVLLIASTALWILGRH
jgi:hypothetical protein